MYEQHIIGYQWDPETGKFIGVYVFPNNADKEEVHLPPNTTLEQPPEPLSRSQTAFRRNGSWVLAADPGYLHGRPPIDNYSVLDENIVSFLASKGMWDAEDQQNFEAAMAHKQEVEAQQAQEREALLALELESAEESVDANKK